MIAPNFPDAPRSETTKTPTTIENVQALLDFARIRCRYNTVKKRVEIDIPDHEGSADNHDNSTLSTVLSLARRYGMPTVHVSDFIDVIADRNVYNPVADWIDSVEWDGIDRLPPVLATLTASPNYPEELKHVLVCKWLRSAAAAAIVPNYRGRGVLTLQGPQGRGKTSWVKRLVSDAKLRESVVKLDHHLDAGNKDSMIQAIENWIVEIGELESSFRRDIARLKGFLTSDNDRLRLPYARRGSSYPRKTVFVATVNDTSFLADSTGNTRWWTIAVESIDFQHDIDMQQVFAQAAAEVRSGEHWWLTREEETMLEAWNGRHVVVSAIAEMVAQRIDHDRIGFADAPYLTASQVCEVIGIKAPTNSQAKECGAALRNLIGDPSRIQGIMKWRVPLKEATAADLFDAGRSPKPARNQGVANMSSAAVAPSEVF